MNTDRETISYLIGQRIQGLRKKQKMSQEELALLSDIHPAYLGRVERGEKCPTVQTLFKISQGLKVPLPQLMDIDARLEHTNLEAMQRIQNAIDGLNADEAMIIAEIVEKAVAFKKHV